MRSLELNLNLRCNLSTFNMRFNDLVKNLKKEVRGITDDSRKVKKGFLFVAIRGLTFDGHKFISQAIGNGAKIIIGEDNLKLGDVVYIKVSDSRKALGGLASAWYGDPSRKLKVIGVTGTDGKTTASNLIYWILKTAGKKVGLVSTINARIGNKEYDTGFHVTNPEPLLLQKLLFEMVKKKCEYAILEVTSHGLDQERVVGVKFDIGVLTNITHEHIDYHKTFRNYRDVKAKLFKNIKLGILNKDDKSFKFMSTLVKQSGKVLSYGVGSDSNFKAYGLENSKDGVSFKLENDGEKYDFEMQLLGNYNVSNALAAIAVARILKISWRNTQKAVENFKPLIGRLEKIKNSRDFKIYVDFAHTPNALEKVLTLLRERREKGRLIAVFGCAGERDIEKRKLMPVVSIKLADISIFTAEDPRSEKIKDILKVMVNSAEKIGGRENVNFYRILERGEAIYFAINKIAKKDDIIVICGKGHERSMAYNGVEYPWADQEAVRMALRGRMKEIKWKKN